MEDDKAMPARLLAESRRIMKHVRALVNPSSTPGTTEKPVRRDVLVSLLATVGSMRVKMESAANLIAQAATGYELTEDATYGDDVAHTELGSESIVQSVHDITVACGVIRHAEETLVQNMHAEEVRKATKLRDARSKPPKEDLWA